MGRPEPLGRGSRGVPGAGETPGKLGAEAETLAARHLAGNGYRVLDRNWRAGRRELDLVVRRGEVVAFVEVKARGPGPQDPREALNRKKRREVRRAAEAWIHLHPGVGREFRFDVVAVRARAGRPVELEHIPNAFFGEDC
ncbi:MAG: YraN family protein [Gemmatimonadota bacterium]